MFFLCLLIRFRNKNDWWIIDQLKKRVFEEMAIEQKPQHIFYLVYFLNMFILFLKVYMTNFALGYHKFKENKRNIPEDESYSSFFKKYNLMSSSEGTTNSSTSQLGNTERFQNIARNEFENFLPFIFSSTCFLISFVTLPHTEVENWVHFVAGTIFMCGFTILRILFSMFYQCGLQPFRTISFFGAFLCNCSLMMWSLLCICF